jgi:hypothetical protein
MKNRKIVIDTNVLISAIIGKGYSQKILKIIFIDKHLFLCTSQNCIEEFERVLKYKRLAKYSEIKLEAFTILEQIKIFGIQYAPAIKLSVLKDESDNKFLKLSVEAKADYLITGNHNDFTLTEFMGTKIISPKRFYEMYEQNKL